MHGTGRFIRGRVRTLATLWAALIVGVAVAACGSSQHRSNADPAAVVPASVPLYAALQVPSSGQLGQYRQIVTELAGARAWTQLSDSFTRMLAKQKVSWNRDIDPWIGSQIGVAVMNLAAAAGPGNSDSGVVMIFPTNDIKDALAFEKRTRDSHSGEVARQDGAYMLVSNAATLAAFTSAGGPRLTADAGYSDVHKRLADDEAMLYGNIHGILDQVEKASPAATSPKLTAALAKLPSDAAAGIGLANTARSVSLDIIPHDLSAHSASGSGQSASSVANLPGDSIVAAAANLTLSSGVLKSFDASFLKALTASFSRTAGRLAGAGVAQRKANGVLAMIDALAPAFGPLQLSIGGSGLLGLHGGLVMKSADPSAAAKLLSLAFTTLKRSGSLPVTGNARNFSLDEGPFKVHFALSSGQLLALLNEANPSNLLSSSSPLSSQSAYRTASARLPVGTTSVPFYLSFTNLDRVVGSLLDAQARSNPQDAQVAGVLKKLSYLIVGRAPGEIRIVLGLN